MGKSDLSMLTKSYLPVVTEQSESIVHLSISKSFLTDKEVDTLGSLGINTVSDLHEGAIVINFQSSAVLTLSYVAATPKSVRSCKFLPDVFQYFLEWYSKDKSLILSSKDKYSRFQAI